MSLSVHRGFSLQICQTDSFSYYTSQQILKYAELFQDGFIGIKMDAVGIAVEKSVAFVSIVAGMMEKGITIAYLPRTTPNQAWSVGRYIAVSAIITDTLLEGQPVANRQLFVPDLGVFYIYVLSNRLTFCRRNNILFIARTSGTTGLAKVVHVTYESIKRNIDFYASYFLDFINNSPVFWGTSLTFDPAFLEMYTAMIHGAVLTIPDKSWDDPMTVEVSSIMKYMSFSFLHITPTKLLLLSEEKILFMLRKVNHLLVGGESFPLTLFKKYEDKGYPAKIYNLYGVTELSCWATIKYLTNGYPYSGVDIGVPFPNTTIRVHDGKFVISGPKCFVNFEAVEEVRTDDVVQILNGNHFVVSRFKVRGVRLSDAAVRCVLRLKIPNVVHALLTNFYHTSVLIVIVRIFFKDIEALTDVETKCTTAIMNEIPPAQRPTCIIAAPADQLHATANGKADVPMFIKRWLEPMKCLNVLKGMGIDTDCPMETKLSTMGLDSLQCFEVSNLLLMLFRDGTVTNHSLMLWLRRPETTIGEILNLFRVYKKNDSNGVNDYLTPKTISIHPYMDFVEFGLRHWPAQSCIDGRIYSIGTHYITATVDGSITILDQTASIAEHFKAKEVYFSQPNPTNSFIFIGTVQGIIFKFSSEEGLQTFTNVLVAVSGPLLWTEQFLYIPSSTVHANFLLRMNLRNFWTDRLEIPSSMRVSPSIHGKYIHLPCCRDYLIVSLETFSIVAKFNLFSPVLKNQFTWKGHLFTHTFLGQIYISSLDGRTIRESGILPPTSVSPVFIHEVSPTADWWCFPTTHSRLFIVKATLENELVTFEPIYTMEFANIRGFLHPPIKVFDDYWIVSSSSGQFFACTKEAFNGSTELCKQLYPISGSLEIMGTPVAYGSTLLFGSRNNTVFEISLNYDKLNVNYD